MEMDIKNIPAIEYRNVSLSFDEKQVLTNVNLSLQRGEMIFITGVSGSGKSVLLRLAIGLERPDTGQVFIDGRDLAALDEAELLDVRSRHMGMVFQEDSLFTGITAYNNVAYRLTEHGVSEEETDKACWKYLGLSAWRMIRKNFRPSYQVVCAAGSK